MDDWFYCSRCNYRVKPSICEARKKKGACIEKEVRHGRGNNRTTETICEPNKKQSKEKRNEALIFDMAVNGTYERGGGE